MTSGFSVFWYAPFDSVDTLATVYGALVPGSRLFVAVCCRGVHENADFLGGDIRGYFRIQRLLVLLVVMHLALCFSTAAPARLTSY